MSIFKKIQDFTARGTGTTTEDVALCLKRMGGFEIDCEGFLTKRGKVRKSWKKRYCVLCAPGVLLYMENKNGVDFLRTQQVSRSLDRTALTKAASSIINNAHILGSVYIRSHTALARLGEYDGKLNVFSVTAPAPSNRVFYFSAPSKADADRWEDKIRLVDQFEQRQQEKERKEEEEKEQRRREAIRNKYMALLPTAKDPYTGGTVRCGDEVWTYTAGGTGDEHPAIIQQVKGRHADKNIKFSWNGTLISMGQVSMVGDDKGGWGLWNGKRMEWRTPASLDKRGRGQAWEYTPDADWRYWKASAFTMRMHFPTAWKFVDAVTLKPESNSMVLDIPNEVLIEGSVPPMVALACGMYNASRKEAIIQHKILREIQAEEREKRMLQSALERQARQGGSNAGVL